MLFCDEQVHLASCRHRVLLQPSALLRRHRLKLVTTSKVCDLRLREPPANPAAALEHGDAMAADPLTLLKAAGVEAPEAQAEAAAAARGDVLSTVDLAAAAAGAAPGASKTAAGPSPVDAVAASLSAAAAAASAAASTAAQGVYTAAVPYAGAVVLGPARVLLSAGDCIAHSWFECRWCTALQCRIPAAAATLTCRALFLASCVCRGAGQQHHALHGQRDSLAAGAERGGAAAVCGGSGAQQCGGDRCHCVGGAGVDLGARQVCDGEAVVKQRVLSCCRSAGCSGDMCEHIATTVQRQ